MGVDRRDGNAAAPINRDTYGVTAVRSDGGLTVARVVDRGVEGEVLGAPLALPASYVAADLAHAYASTAPPEQHDAGSAGPSGHRMIISLPPHTDRRLFA